MSSVKDPDLYGLTPENGLVKQKPKAVVVQLLQKKQTAMFFVFLDHRVVARRQTH